MCQRERERENPTLCYDVQNLTAAFVFMIYCCEHIVMRKINGVGVVVMAEARRKLLSENKARQGKRKRGW